MAKKGEISRFEEQKKIKPTLRSVIDQLYDEKLREIGIDLLEYLASLRSTPSWYASNSYNINYKGKRVCRIRIDPRINPHTGMDEGTDYFRIHIFPLDMLALAMYLADMPENERKLYFDGINKCTHCSGCSPGTTVEVGDIIFKEVCGMVSYKNFIPGHYEHRNKNLAPAHLKAIKKLIELRRQDIANGRE